jgi:hypothetical protein
VPLGFDFILYRHGPFSFDLRDELVELRAVGYLDLEAREQPYGPSFRVTTDGQELVGEHRKTVAQFEREMSFVVDKLADKNVSELERLATALFITLRDGQGDERSRAQALHAAKWHISEDEAMQAIRTVDSWIRESCSVAS